MPSAKARGRNGGRPSKNRKEVATAIKMYDSKLHSVAEIEKETGIAKAILYRTYPVTKAYSYQEKEG
ncbi:MAG: helix-turn-helix domain-containing protein [Solirubrobacterales bacterium]